MKEVSPVGAPVSSHRGGRMSIHRAEWKGRKGRGRREDAGLKIQPSALLLSFLGNLWKQSAQQGAGCDHVGTQG